MIKLTDPWREQKCYVTTTLCNCSWTCKKRATLFNGHLQLLPYNQTIHSSIIQTIYDARIKSCLALPITWLHTTILLVKYEEMKSLSVVFPSQMVQIFTLHNVCCIVSVLQVTCQWKTTKCLHKPHWNDAITIRHLWESTLVLLFSVHICCFKNKKLHPAVACGILRINASRLPFLLQ